MSNRIALALVLVSLAGCMQPPVGHIVRMAPDRTTTAAGLKATVAIGIAWPRAFATQAIPRDTQTVFITIRDGAGTAVQTDDPVTRPAGSTLQTVTYALTVGTGYTLSAVAKAANGTTLATGTTTFNVADGAVPTDPVLVNLAMVPATATRYIQTIAGNPVGTGTRQGIALGRTTGLARAADGTLYMGSLAKNMLLRLVDNTFTLFSGGPVGLAAPVGTPTILGQRWYGTGGLTLDGYGNLIGTDLGTHTIKLMVQGAGTPAGYFGVANPVVGNSYVIAGTYAVTGSTDGLGTAAKFNAPGGIAIGPAGDLFVCDTLNGRIRRIAAATGQVTTFTPVPMAIPINLVYDGTDFWVTESSGHVLRKISGTTGLSLQTIGSFLTSGNVDGAFAGVRFRTPTALTQGPAGHLIVTDQRVDGTGWNLKDVNLTTSQVATLTSHTIGVASDFIAPSVVWDGATSYVISDDVLKVWNGTTLSVYAGNGSTSTTIPLNDGVTATSVQIGNPVGLAVDSARKLWTVVADGALRTVGPDGLLHTVLAAATFNAPVSAAIDAADNLYVTTNGDSSVYRIPAGTTVPARFIGTGNGGSAGNGGVATAAALSMPAQVTVDAQGNAFVADTGNHAIRMRWAGGTYTYGIANPTVGNLYTIAGTLGAAGAAATPAAAIGGLLNGPKGVAVDADGNVLFSDSANFAVRMIYAGTTGGSAYGLFGLVQGQMYVVAGQVGQSGWTDGYDGGLATNARIGRPQALAVDSLGAFYICDYLDVNNPTGGLLLKVAADGTIRRIAGAGPAAVSGYGDGGDPRLAALDGPAGIWVDSRGDTIYLAPGAADTIRLITP
jgi:sugar lactone lactonase YvrE